MNTKFTLILLFILCSISGTIHAQPQFYNYDVAGTPNSFPLNQAAGKEVQWIFLPGDFNQPNPSTAGTIYSLSFYLANDLGPFTYTDLKIQLAQTNDVELPLGGFYANPLTLVYSRASVSLSGTSGQWLSIALDAPFTYDPTKSLVLDIQQSGAPGANGFSISQTTQAGRRRSWSLGGSPFVYSSQDGRVVHLGLDMTPPVPLPVSSVPVSPWAVAGGLFLIAGVTFVKLHKRIMA